MFRVSIGYLVSVWLVSQAADFGLDLIGAPDWVVRAIVLILALGFPIVVFFAWAYEVTPEGIKKEADVDRTNSITHVTGKKLDKAIIVMLILALGYFIWESRFASEAPSQQVETAQVTEASQQVSDSPVTDTSTHRQSIAVLPFENRSNIDDDQFFTDGIHDDLITTLAKIGSMKVISRTSVMEYRDTTKKIPEIATELGVAHVLEGGIQRSGNQVRINVQLLDAQTDEHLWAEIFDRELTAENLFAIQSEISNKIAEALQTALTPDEQQRVNAMPTDNLAAYEAYLRGKQLMASRRIEQLLQATREFETAVELDPEFALAWVGVADSTYLWANYSGDGFENTIEKRQEAVDKALELDPGLGEAWVSQATIFDSQDQTEESESAYRKAIELSPNYATAYHWYSSSLSNDLLRTRERLELGYKAVELDPRSLIIRANLVSELFRGGQYSQGEQRARDMIDLTPEFLNPYGMLINHYQWQTGEYAKALLYSKRFAEVNPDDVDALRPQIEILAQVGDLEAAQELQDEVAVRWPESPFANWAEFIVALEKRNIPVLRESFPWLTTETVKVPWFNTILAFSYYLTDDFEKSKEIYLQTDPRWIEPESWEMALRDDPDQGCFMAWLLLKTGDTEIGTGLLEVATDFHDNLLPAAIEHSDALSPDVCYMASGDYDKALASLEMQMAHGHIFAKEGAFQAAIYDPIRQEPRFIAVQQERTRKTELQRELIDQMRANGEI